MNFRVGPEHSWDDGDEDDEDDDDYPGPNIVRSDPGEPKLTWMSAILSNRYKAYRRGCMSTSTDLEPHAQLGYRGCPLAWEV